MIMDVSFANRIRFNGSAVILGRSFLYSKENKRPSMNLEERHVLFYPILNNVILLEVLLFISTL